MATLATSTVVEANGLPIHRIELPGTRALTVMVAFDAGARNERPRRTGWRTSSSISCSRAARSTRPTATSTRRPSASAACSTRTPATTSSPSTSRCAPRAPPPAIDLLSDFVGRPRIDADELDRERGVVIQEINRAYDSAVDRRRVPDRPRSVRRAPARAAPCSGRRRTCAASPATGSSPSASAAGPARAAAPSWPATSTTCRQDELHELFGASRRCPSPIPTSRHRSSRRRRSSSSATPTSRTCG